MQNNETDYILSCCSTADLSAEHFARQGIEYVCFHYELDGRQYLDDLGKSMSFEDFYQAMADGADTKTSQVSTGEFVEYFEPFLKEGKDVLHVCLSSGLSGTINSALMAKSILEEKYPERSLYIVDSLGASSGYGLLMDTLADLKKDGMGIRALYDWVEQHKLEVQYWFFSTDLSFYVKGGRISKTSGFVGKVLGVCPLLNTNSDGRLVPRKKIVGKKKVIRAIVDAMEQHAQGGLDYCKKCYISQSACMEDARKVAELVKSRFKHLCGEIVINPIGTTIGSHTGPGTVALFFWGSKRMPECPVV
ncbi:MAG TPA: DegV family protein [Eubacteriales bacterium]|nr:DegV family protein [Eubacteriales bacterium]